MNLKINSKKLEFEPVTIDKWRDFEQLFGERGACGGCWCMYWRLKRSEFNKQKGEKNKEAMKDLVKSGEIPGILAYLNKKPIGWCSIGPREVFSALERSRILKPVDDKSVWSIVCFFIDKSFRKKGISTELIKAAIDYASKKGAKIIESYPIDPKKDKIPDVFAYVGLASTFLKAGFIEVIRRSETRPIMRYFIKNS